MFRIYRFRIYVPDLCSGCHLYIQAARRSQGGPDGQDGPHRSKCTTTTTRVYVLDLCSGSMFRIYVPAKAARVARTAKMGPPVKMSESCNLIKELIKELLEKNQGEIF